MIGPVHGPIRPSDPLALPKGPPRIFATLGTHLPWARARWERGVYRLAQAHPDVHFTLTQGGQSVTAIEALPNLLVTPFADYATEVPRHDAVLHHGGSGIAYAAIEAGKPSLVVPHDFDQFDYAARIAHFGLGLRRKTLAGASRAVDALLSEDWPAVEAFASAARRYDPKARFLETLATFGL
jgi:UDP:flavonoid glycosyltransferase YjiC (YdhE family)